ncbi:unnamed protein product, partial [Staurois parvus]
PVSERTAERGQVASSARQGCTVWQSCVNLRKGWKAIQIILPAPIYLDFMCRLSWFSFNLIFYILFIKQHKTEYTLSLCMYQSYVFFFPLGLPALTITVWIKTRISFDDTGCWDDYENNYWWIIKTPILMAIFLNFIIFLNVIRILMQKIRSPDISKNYKQQYMRLAKSTLLLIPLFGIHYVVFALFPEHIGVWARLYFELVLGSTRDSLWLCCIAFLMEMFKLRSNGTGASGKVHWKAMCSTW